MTTRTYQCERCGETFTYNSDRDALYCPICGSVARAVSRTTTSTGRNTVSNGRYVNVTFTDPSTNIRIASATVPDGWKYGAAIKNYNQSLLVNYLGICQVQKADGSALMFAKTGDNFLDVRQGLNQDEVHKDGQVNKYMNIPMLRLDSTENYINSIAPDYAETAKLSATAASKLPSYYGENSKIFLQEMNKEINEFAACFKNSDVTFEAGAPVTESKLIQYTYTQNRTKYVLLLGTDLGAYEFRLTSKSAAQNTNMMSLLTNLMGAQQTASGQYIHWGSKLIFGLITTEAAYNETSREFLNFVNSFKLDGSYKNNLKKIGTTTTTKKSTTSSNQNSTGLNLTDILTSLLNATGTGNNSTEGQNNLNFDWTKLFK